MIRPGGIALLLACMLNAAPAQATKAWHDIYATFQDPIPENALFALKPLLRESDIPYLQSMQIQPRNVASGTGRLQRWASGIDVVDGDTEAVSEPGRENNPDSDEDRNPDISSDKGSDKRFPMYSNYARDSLYDSPLTSLWSPGRDRLYWMGREYGFSSKIISLLFYHYSPDPIPGKENYSGFVGVDFYSNWLFHSSDHGISSLTFELGGQKNLNGNGKGKDMGENVGSLITSNVVLGDTDPIIGDIYFTQGFMNNRVLFNAGRITPWYYYGYNVFTDSEVQRFSSDIFSGGTAIPEGGGNGSKPGASIQLYPNDVVYFSAVLTNTEGEDSDFDFDMINPDAYFLGAEIGYLSVSASGLKTLYSLGLHTAKKKQDDGSRKTGNGFNLMLQTELSPRGYTPYAGVFVQYQYSDPRIADVEEQLSIGLNINHAFHRRSDAFGLGVGTIKPSDSTKNREYFSESYYRLQLTENVQWSFNLQLYHKPSDPAQEKSLVPVYGTRIFFEF